MVSLGHNELMTPWCSYFFNLFLFVIVWFYLLDSLQMKSSSGSRSLLHLPVMTHGKDLMPVLAATREPSYVSRSSIGSSWATRWSIDTANTHSLSSSCWASWRGKRLFFRALFQFKDCLSRNGIHVIKIRQLWDCLIFIIMGLPITVRWHRKQATDFFQHKEHNWSSPNISRQS